MSPLELVEFIANGNAAQFVVEHGFLALKQRALEVLEVYEAAQREAWQAQQAEYNAQHVVVSSDVL